jgi:CRISPR system Cascade subunit CasE
MYLTCLLVNVGDNPDRPRPGRLWLRNLYHVHQRLCMAFPSAARKSDDPDFLAPYRPEDFPEQRHFAGKRASECDRTTLNDVHAPRDANRGFLFRIDPQRGGRVAIIVQSAVVPDWDYAFHNAGHFLAAAPQVRTFEPLLAVGERYCFRLLANPTRKVDTKTGSDVRRNNGRRVAVSNDRLFEWLACRAEAAGFSVDQGSTIVQPGYVYMKRPDPPGKRLPGQRLRSVRYDGTLAVADAACLQATLAKGIGPGKAFGFGLLSLARTAS